jgi:hypothetical protein
MEYLPVEMHVEILGKVDPIFLLDCLIVFELWYELCMGMVVPINSKKKYRQACERGDILSVIHAKEQYYDEGMRWAGRRYPRLVRHFIRKGATNCNGCLEYACENGQLEIINLVLAKGANNFTLGFNAACFRGRIDIARMMLEKGAIPTDESLLDACWGGNEEIVDLVMSRGISNWNFGLNGACRNGNIGLILRLIELGANNFSNGIEEACLFGHKDVVELMIANESPETRARALNRGLYAACFTGKREFVDFIICKGANNWGFVFPVACRSHNLELVQFIYSKGITQPCLNKGLRQACKLKRTKIVKWLIGHGATQCQCGKTIVEH